MSVQNSDKVMQFREDRRLNVISALRSIALAGMLATIVFCILAYHEDLNLDNIKRIVSYIDRLTFDGRPTDTYVFDSGLDTTYAAFDVGIAACSGGSFRFIPPFEDMDYSCQIKYASPQIETCGQSLYVYDLGGRGISRFNSYSLLGSVTLDSDIISLSANDSGDISVVTDEKGYRTAVTVYSKRFKELYKWQTSDHFAFLSALSPDGGTAAVLCIGQQNGAARFYIRLQPTDGGECRAEIDLGGMKVYSLEYYSNDRLVVLGEDGIYCYDQDGKQSDSFGFNSGSLITFSHERGGMCAVSLKGEKGDSSSVHVFDGRCREVYSRDCSGAVRFMDFSGDTVAFITPEGVVKADIAGGEEQQAELSGARGVLITETGNVAAVYSDHAQTVSFEETGE